MTAPVLRNGDPAEVGMSPDRVRRAARLGAEWVERGITPALSVCVARRGVVVLHEAWGRFGPEPDAPRLRTDAIYPVASLTKPITATAVMCLVEDGLLGLNRPVQEYVPEFVGEGKEAVMVHHLLTHTAGVADEDADAHARAKIAAGAPIATDDPTVWPVVRAWPSLLDLPLRRAPGVEMSYSNYGYLLLGKEILPRLVGDVDAFVARRVFEPLGMADTSYGVVPDALHERYVRRRADGPFTQLNRVDLRPMLRGAASASSTARDLAAFGQMFLGRGAYGDRRVLSPASTRTMGRNQIPGVPAQYGAEYFPEASWGYGWGVQGNKKATRDCSFFSAETLAHGGAGGSFMWVDPVAEVVGVYLSVMTTTAGDPRNRSGSDLFANTVMSAVDA